MPIKPENRARYPENWEEISEWVRFVRARGRCECRGECGRDHAIEHRRIGLADEDSERCTCMHGWENPMTGSNVVLTTAHLDHQPENCEADNLRAMCQRCHLGYDAEHHLQTAYYERRCDHTIDMFED